MNLKEIEINNKLLRESRINCIIPKKLERLESEMSCINMIMSCLTYGYNFMNSEYKEDYIKELGYIKVKALYDIQESYVMNECSISRSVYIDNEGCSYNSISES